MLTIISHQGNVNQNHSKTAFYTQKDGYNKKESVSKNVEKLETLYIAGGNTK